MANGYPGEMVKNSDASQRAPLNETGQNDTVCLPYVKGVSVNVRIVIKNLNIRAVLRPISLKVLADKSQDHTDPNNT